MIQKSSPKVILDSQPSAQPNPIKKLEFEEDNLTLRPAQLDQIIGQSKIVKQLHLMVDSAKIRGVMPEHILFYGQPGLGKTTLASLIGRELQCSFKVITAPSLQKVGDLVSLLLGLEEKTVLFIDEIHRLKAPLEETLYSAMEDGQVDLVMGKGNGISSLRMPLPNFTLVGATTQLGKISKPLKDRFSAVFQLEPYSKSEIATLIDRSSLILDLSLEREAVDFLSQRVRGVPRIANNLLKRLLDFQIVHKVASLTEAQVQEILSEMGIGERGLTQADLGYMRALIDDSLGIKTLAGVLMEEVETVETVIEPYLIHLGFINKSSEGRSLTIKGRQFLGLDSVSLL